MGGWGENPNNVSVEGDPSTLQSNGRPSQLRTRRLYDEVQGIGCNSEFTESKV